MKVLIMAGGRGSRIGDPSKPLIKILGKPMIEYVIDAINGLGEMNIATTKNHERIIQWARSNNYTIVLTSGRDYPNDLIEALRLTGTPTLVLPSDMPLLSKEFITKFLRAVAHIRTPMVTLAAVRGCEIEYTGISYIRDLTMSNGVIPWSTLTTAWTMELININTREDLEEATKLIQRRAQQPIRSVNSLTA
ncbi:GTP--adenosylcobinamide-phosphate guanylyltransferase [Vulcanisaeta sp. SCGC AB-777_J10]|nr:GTP--adenosylcobinamide-phosphate guanylyltransferase [Vulcanisaeta sp. SCGC AB-777_J10]